MNLRTFIDNEDLSPFPSHQSRTRGPDVTEEFFNVIDRGRDRAPRVQSHACHGILKKKTVLGF